MNRPLYLQARDRLLPLVRNKPVGDALPHERDLAEEWGVSRITIRNAYARLVEEGYVVKTHRAYRPSPRLSRTGLFMLDGFTQDALQKGLVPRTEVVGVDVIIPPSEIAKALMLPRQGHAYLLKRRRFLNERLVCMESGYLGAHLVPSLEAYSLESLYDVLQTRYGIIVHWAEQSFRFDFGRSAERKQLHIAKGVPLLHLRRVSFTIENLPVEYVEASYNLLDFEFYVKVQR